MKELSEQKIAICADHAGFELKELIMTDLGATGVEFKDFGTYSTASCDYPDFAHPMADAIEKGEFEYGIAICGSGNGISMTANKHQGIRAAICWKPELAVLARQHNNANVLSLPARFISEEEAFEIIEDFFKTDFEGGRHVNRVNKIPLHKA
ncbi:MAG: ribose 5-phosphate isomerase B [Paludibacteraceae bacterium]|nr:ribose 5-phosphate isomerase B [Paludibacteraceae bacterium]